MRYGVFIKDVTEEMCEKEGIGGKQGASGESFVFENFDSTSYAGPVFVSNGDYILASWAVEISESEYNRLKKKPTPTMHPTLQEAFDKGDWGCQESSVKGVLEAISKILEDAK